MKIITKLKNWKRSQIMEKAFEKGWKWIKKIIIRVIHIDDKPIVIHHEEPIPVDPPIKPKEEEK